MLILIYFPPCVVWWGSLGRALSDFLSLSLSSPVCPQFYSLFRVAWPGLLSQYLSLWAPTCQPSPCCGEKGPLLPTPVFKGIHVACHFLSKTLSSFIYNQSGLSPRSLREAGKTQSIWSSLRHQGLC